jgi:hypothetical protein
MNNVVNVATVLVIVAPIYVSLGMSGYIVFGGLADESNVLQSEESDDVLILVARICMCCLLSVSFLG